MALVTLREELETVLRYEAGVSESVTKLMLTYADGGSTREFSTDEWLETLLGLHLGLREALFRLADRVESLEPPRVQKMATSSPWSIIMHFTTAAHDALG